MPTISSKRSSGRASAPRTAARRSAGANPVFKMLSADHARVKKAFRQFEKLDERDIEGRQELVERVCHELEVHTMLEEEFFYPALQEAGADEQTMEEADIEHTGAKTLIAQLKQMHPGDARYAATFKVLGEYVRHHADEEEKTIFSEAKKAKLDFDAMAEDMQARKEELTESEES